MTPHHPGQYGLSRIERGILVAVGIIYLAAVVVIIIEAVQ